VARARGTRAQVVVRSAEPPVSSRLPARTALAGRRPTDRRSRTRTASSTTGIGRRAACADRSCRAARQRDSTHAAARPPARTAARTRAPDPDGDGSGATNGLASSGTRDHVNRKRLPGKRRTSGNARYCECSSMNPAATHAAMPIARRNQSPRTSFSVNTTSVMATTQSRFMTPPTNSSSINAQQQPRQ